MPPFSSKVIIFVAVRAFAVSNSRLSLILKLKEKGWRVVISSAADGSEEAIQKTGADFVPLPIRRGGFCLKDIQTLFFLVRLYWKYQPKLIQHFHGKPIILGTLAALCAPKAKVINTITGLGFPYLEKNTAFRLFIAAFRLLQGRSSMDIFQNQDDHHLFLEKGWTQANRSELIVSSGVDTQKFLPSNETMKTAYPLILMAGRLVWMKGVREFCEAAASVKRQYPQARFQLAGNFDPVHPDAVPEKWILEQIKHGNIDYLGFRSDLPDLLRQTWIAVLPSYREGTPRFLLEAAASAVPVVTTDAPGCRETVVSGVTGKTVPVRDAQALAQAILELLENQESCKNMGKAGRQRMEQEFDIRLITEKYLKIYEKVEGEKDFQ